MGALKQTAHLNTTPQTLDPGALCLSVTKHAGQAHPQGDGGAEADCSPNYYTLTPKPWTLEPCVSA